MIGAIIASNEVLLIVMCAMMTLDIASGLVKAFSTGTYSSSIMREGLYHKLAYLILVLVSAFLELTLNVPDLQLGFEIPMLGATCAYVIMTEFFSIIENLSAINPTIAQFTGKYLQDVDVESKGKHAA